MRLFCRILFLALLGFSVVIEFTSYGARAGFIMLLGIGALISYGGAIASETEKSDDAEDDEHGDE